MGISTSRLCDRRAYRGRIDGEYRMRAPSVASRSRTRGWRTATRPMPVMISRSGRWPWRTTRCWPVSVLRSVCFARNSATSASTAWVSNARAPLRRISVRESVKAPGWASLMTLLSDTAYHSFIGEVEALNTTTIRRLTRSRRHQLLAIALRHARRSTDAAIPGYDCRIRTGTDSRTVPPRQASSRQGRGSLGSGWCTLWLPLHPQDQRDIGTLRDRCCRSRSRAVGLRQVYGGWPEHRRDCPAATRDGGPHPSAGSLGTIGRLGDPAQPGLQGNGLL